MLDATQQKTQNNLKTQKDSDLTKAKLPTKTSSQDKNTPENREEATLLQTNKKTGCLPNHTIQIAPLEGSHSVAPKDSELNSAPMRDLTKKEQAVYFARMVDNMMDALEGINSKELENNSRLADLKEVWGKVSKDLNSTLKKEFNLTSEEAVVLKKNQAIEFPFSRKTEDLSRSLEKECKQSVKRQLELPIDDN